MPRVTVVGTLIHYGPEHKAFETLRVEAGKIVREITEIKKEETSCKYLQTQTG